MFLRKTGLAAIPLALGTLGICGVGAAGTPQPPSSLGADGWSTYYPSGKGVTNGGGAADQAHIYTVTNRSELLKALYPDVAIAPDGSFTSAAGADKTPKIIYVKGTINLSADANNRELGFNDYKVPAFDFDAYVAAYKPSVWNADPANWDAKKMAPTKLTGPLEDARAASAERQAKIVAIHPGSNTSLIGLGKDARIIKGSIFLGPDVDNIVIRNITFEDAFDYFPAWDPADSFSLDKSYSGCQATYVDARTGPHKCPGGRWNSEYDLITVRGGTHVWIDHCTFTDGEREDHLFPSVFPPPYVGYDYVVQHHDGMIDVTRTSDFVTLSYNHFKNHDKTNLIGGSDTVTPEYGWGALSVTLHHNYYENAGQRLPRVRMGKVHVYNNYYTGQVSYFGAYGPTDDTPVPHNRFLYGIGIGHLAKIYSENNVFDVKPAPTKLQPNDSVMFHIWHKAPTTAGQHTYFHDSGTMLNGVVRDVFAAANQAAIAANKPPLQKTDQVWKPSDNYHYTADPANAVKAKVLANAGAGKL